MCLIKTTGHLPVPIKQLQGMLDNTALTWVLGNTPTKFEVDHHDQLKRK